MGSTDVPFDVEPLALPLPDGGTAPQGSRFVVDLRIGGAPAIRAFLDTGSSGIVLAPDAPPETLSAAGPGQGGFSVTYGSGVTATGVLGAATVTLGALTTAAPIPVAVVQQLSGGAAALQQLFGGSSAIVGIGMRNYSSALGNPIVQMPGNPAYVVMAPDFGGTTGTLRIAPSAGDLAGYRTVQLAPAPSTFPALAGGVPAWNDNGLAGCVTNATTGQQLCASTILDTGDPGAYLYWPGYTGSSPFPPGSVVDVAVGPSSSPAGSFTVTVGASPQYGLDRFDVVPSSQGHISLGTTIFARFDVLFDQVRGTIGLSPHASTVSPPSDAGLPCDVKYDCPAGQTCWSPNGTVWTCAPDGTAPVGSSCNPSGSAAVTCGDRMACLGNGGSPPTGMCRYWCDASDPCPAGAGTCTPAHTTAGATLSFCL